MSQRTFLLTGTATDFGGNVLGNAPCSFAPILPGGSGAMIDGNGDFVSMSPVAFRTNPDGTFPTLTVDFPGDFQTAYQQAQVRVTVNGVITDSPISFGYASSIDFTDWINATVATGLVVMRAVYTKDDGTPIPGAIGSVTLSDSATVVATGQFRSSNNPVQSVSATDGTMTFSLDPNNALDPSDLGYILQISGEPRPWSFVVPAAPDTYKGAWSNSTTYHGASGSSNGDVVVDSGVLYRYINVTPSSGHATSDATRWAAVVGLPTDLIAAHITVIGPSNGTTIDATGIRHTAGVPPIPADPNQAPATLADDMLNIRYEAVHGAAGPIALYYLFDATTTNSNPGSGKLRLNQATQDTATAIYANTSDDLGVDWTAVLDTLDASSSTVKGAVRLVKVLDRTAWLAFNLTARTSHTGYREFAVTETGASAASPFTNGDELVFLFSRTGDQGDAGSSLSNPMTAEGDLITGGASGTPRALPIGNQHYALASVGTDPAYIAPQAVSGWALPLTSDYDLLVRKAATTTTAAVGFIGDSITAGTAGAGGSGGAPPVTCCTALSIGGLTVSPNNQGVTSLSSTDWLPGGSHLPGVITAFQGAGIRIVHIQLGTNDQLTTVLNSAATYYSNMRSICTTLVNAGFLVVLSFNPWLPAGTGYGAGGSRASANAQFLLYQQQLMRLVDGVSVFLGNTLAYEYFRLNPGEIQGDTVHPTTTGNVDLGGQWADALRPLVNQLYGNVVYQRAVLGTGLTTSVVGGVVTINATAGAGLRTASIPLTIAGGASPTFVTTSAGDLVACVFVY